jgi:hypothetical protein
MSLLEESLPIEGRRAVPHERTAAMKLLHCLACGDVQRLHEGPIRPCECGRSTGDIDDAGRAEINGPARVLLLTGTASTEGWWTLLPQRSNIARRALTPLM